MNPLGMVVPSAVREALVWRPWRVGGEMRKSVWESAVRGITCGGDPWPIKRNIQIRTLVLLASLFSPLPQGPGN